MKNITTYKVIYKQLKLKKEHTRRYNIPPKINSPLDLYQTIDEIFNLKEESEEVFVILGLDTKNKIIGAFEVSRGNLNSSIVHPREIFKRLLLLNSNRFIMAHNHPSGDIKPSSEDKNITQRLKEVGQIMGIPPLDHIIIGEGEEYFSFKKYTEIL